MPHTPRDAASAPTIVHAGKFLSFAIAGEEYGLEILAVHEIIKLQPITPVPRAPANVRGVINLRGRIIPVMDMRRVLGLEEASGDGCIIVVQLRGAHVGLVVDRVSEVLNISAAAIEPPPAFGGDGATRYLLGIAKCDGHVRLLLDIERALSDSEAEFVTTTAGESIAA